MDDFHSRILKLQAVLPFPDTKDKSSQLRCCRPLVLVRTPPVFLALHRSLVACDRNIVIVSFRRPLPFFFVPSTIMGGSLSRLWSFFWSKKEIRILILGLVRDLYSAMDGRSLTCGCPGLTNCLV